MHLPWGGAIEHIQQFHDVGIISVPFEGVSSAIEAKNESIGNPRLVIDVIPIRMMIRKCRAGHSVHGPTGGRDNMCEWDEK